jgi:MOSC domain-containing protein YiiM
MARGQTVYTSVWKEPVQERHLVRRLNIDGDAQGDLAGHGGEPARCVRLPNGFLSLLGA